MKFVIQMKQSCPLKELQLMKVSGGGVLEYAWAFTAPSDTAADEMKLVRLGNSSRNFYISS